MSRYCKLRVGGFVLILLAVSSCTTSQKISPDAHFHTLAEEYLRGHLAWRPAFGMGTVATAGWLAGHPLNDLQPDPIPWGWLED